MTAQCSATSKRSGERCKRAVTPGRNVCHYHGGASPIGVGSASFQSGRYSKALPAKLAERYEAALRDPELLSLRDEIALNDARIAELVGRLNTGESGERWDALAVQFGAVRALAQAGELEALGVALEALGETIHHGADDRGQWQAIADAIDLRRRLAGTEMARLVVLQQMLTAEQAWALLGAVEDVVLREVPDRSVRAAVAGALYELGQRSRVLPARAQPPSSPAPREVLFAPPPDYSVLTGRPVGAP